MYVDLYVHWIRMKSLIFWFCTLIICSYCKVDFKSIGRHSWRCKERIRVNVNDRRDDSSLVETTGNTNSARSSVGINEAATRNQVRISNVDHVECCCGKKCKGVRGLKAHQRSCRFIKGMCSDLLLPHAEENANDYDQISDVVEDTLNETPNLKPGVKLPKTDLDWREADLYFRAELPISEVNEHSVNDCVIKMTNLVYDYFAENFGTVNKSKDSDSEFQSKYANYSKQDLKRELKALKRQSPVDVENIKYVSRLLRKCVQNRRQDNVKAINHDEEIRKNFWAYVKLYLDCSDYLAPTFDLTKCTSYFKNIWNNAFPCHVFMLPNWLPKLSAPTHEFNCTPPTYAKITAIIKRMKSKGSACPLDQFSVIPLKKSAYLRSYLTEIIQTVWKSGQIPDTWRKAASILIHKKESTDDPQNFRPITLQSVPLKVFTSTIRNSMYEFLLKNNYIENRIQKGFTPGVSGTFEHTSHLAYLIRRAKKQQRSLTIALLDLRNAFGEVHHKLIQTVLQYHQIPEHFQNCIGNLYSDFRTTVVTESYQTPFLKVNKGVLQGDCLSPLLFNMVMNTFVQYVKTEQFCQLGFNAGQPFLTTKHWFQFADDAVITTSEEYETQILLNAFTMWCNWAKMTLRVDKCKTFGIMKRNSAAKQYFPKIYVNHSLIPSVKQNESFCYLGRFYNFPMDNAVHKQFLISETNNILEKIDRLPLHSKFKLDLYRKYLLPKISWHLTIADIDRTWIKQTLDTCAIINFGLGLRYHLTVPWIYCS